MTKEFIVTLENKPGTLAEILEGIGKEGVNVRGICCAPTGTQGTVRILADSEAKVETFLKGKNRKYESREVIVRKLPNKPGELAKVTRQLADSGVNIDSVYGYSGTTTGEVELAFEPSPGQIDSARKVLSP